MRHDGGVSDDDQDRAYSPQAFASLSMVGAVRHAVRADLDQLEVALADAFAADPMMAWIYPDAPIRPAHVQAFMRAALDIGFPHGHVYAAGANTAAAIWAPPDVDLFDDQAITTLFGLLSEQLGPRAEEVGASLGSIAEQHPHHVPHFYLFVLGTARAVQSRGLGGSLLHEILERCDRQGLGAYLESSNVRNVPFYERHGFHVLTEVKFSEEFVARPMWRDPRS
jgi:GNAT superfamily N-acetyltransferase